MGNACKKNAAEQVQLPTPSKKTAATGPDDDNELRQLRELNQKLKGQKANLDNELNKWREVQAAKVEEVTKELESVQKEVDEIENGPEGDELTNIRQSASVVVRKEMTDHDKKELELLRQRATYLENELQRLEGERARLAAIRSDAVRESANLEELLKRVSEKAAQESDISDANSVETTESLIRERAMGRVATYYRTVARPQSLTECCYQCRVDCAEFSTQSVRNAKALKRHFETGDDSWYLEKPIRGMCCSMLQCGDEPHDRWHCSLCAILDVTDAPLLL